MTVRTVNPWLKVPIEDYDGHMAEVGQSEILAGVLRDSLQRWPFSRGLCVLGAATGNGFEHIPVQKNERLVAVDLNLTYLAQLKKRHGDRLPHLETVCKDVSRCEFPHAAFDHIHAALFFEYVDPAATLAHIRPWLERDGVLSVVLQRPSGGEGQISPSTHPGVNVLAPLLTLVEPETFAAAAHRNRFSQVFEEEVPVPHGKAFRVMVFRAV